MIVAKVGGSLFDLPDLAARLTRFVEACGDPDWLLVPGGGAAADAVRALDRTHGLGEERSHWLALRACSLNAHFLHLLLPQARLLAEPRGHRGPGILDALAFAMHDAALPRSWDETSDTVAARAAIVAGARLVLLKSVTIPPAMPWGDAARAGYVDAAFANVVFAAGLRVEVVNLRLSA